MPNRVRGEITLRIGDGTKLFKFTAEQIAALDDELGQSVLYLASQRDHFGVALTAKLLTAGLRGAGSKWTERGVRRAMDLGDLDYYRETILDGFKATGLVADDEDEAGQDGDDPLPRTDSPTEPAATVTDGAPKIRSA